MFDPWECMSDLTEAEAHPAIVGCADRGFVAGVAFNAAAVELAISLGRAIVFGVVGQTARTMSPRAATAATQLAATIATATAHLADLGHRWAEVDAVVGDAYILDTLTQDFDFWAASEAILFSEAEVASDALTWAADRFGDARSEWCAELRKQADLLALVAGLPFRANINQTLSPGYQGLAPWWLGEELDLLAKQV